MFTSEKSAFFKVNDDPELGFSARYEFPCTNGDGSDPVAENSTKTPVDGFIFTVGTDEYPVPSVTTFTSVTTPVYSKDTLAPVYKRYVNVPEYCTYDPVTPTPYGVDIFTTDRSLGDTDAVYPVEIDTAPFTSPALGTLRVKRLLVPPPVLPIEVIVAPAPIFVPVTLHPGYESPPVTPAEHAMLNEEDSVIVYSP
jgi:hypothetical protein